MRTILRTFLAAAAIAATALVGPAGAAASSDNLPTFSDRYELDDAWCLDQGDHTDCTVTDGVAVITYKANGDSSLRVRLSSVTDSIDNVTGATIATTKSQLIDRTVYEDGFRSKSFTINHTRYDGPLGSCVATYKLKIVGFEVVVDKYLGPGCK